MNLRLFQIMVKMFSEALEVSVRLALPRHTNIPVQPCESVQCAAMGVRLRVTLCAMVMIVIQL